MAKQKKPKMVNFALSRGIRMNGSPIWPTQTKTVGTGKDAKEEKVPTVICIRETLAKELAAASKGEVTDAKPSFKIVEPVEDDGLDAAFGPESEG